MFLSTIEIIIYSYKLVSGFFISFILKYIIKRQWAIIMISLYLSWESMDKLFYIFY